MINHVLQLEKLGYFKYADKSDVLDLKVNLAECLEKYQEIDTLYFGDDNNPSFEIAKDYRYISVDFENLIESDTADTLNIISEYLKKRNLPFKWEFNPLYDEDVNEIVINGITYSINIEDTSWNGYAYAFAKIVNLALEKLYSDERLYLIASDNNGDFILLNNKLREYFYQHKLCNKFFTPKLPNEFYKMYLENEQDNLAKSMIQAVSMLSKHEFNGLNYCYNVQDEWKKYKKF